MSDGYGVRSDARKRSQEATSPQGHPDATATPVGAQGGDLDVAGIKARVEAATEGPWEARHGSYSWVALYADEDAIPEGDSLPSFEPGGSATPDDAEFIARARTDIPLLLTALDEARAELQRQSDEAQDYHVALHAAESARDAAEGVLRDMEIERNMLRSSLAGVLPRAEAAEGALERVRAEGEIAGQMRHITAEMVRGDQPLDAKEELIADLRARASHHEARAEDADRALKRVVRVCERVESDDRESLNTFGQHLAGSVVVVAEMVRAALDPAVPATKGGE